MEGFIYFKGPLEMLLRNAFLPGQVFPALFLCPGFCLLVVLDMEFIKPKGHLSFGGTVL